jgi:hypothetical protein
LNWLACKCKRPEALGGKTISKVEVIIIFVPNVSTTLLDRRVCTFRIEGQWPFADSDDLTDSNRHHFAVACEVEEFDDLIRLDLAENFDDDLMRIFRFELGKAVCCHHLKKTELVLAGSAQMQA